MVNGPNSGQHYEDILLGPFNIRLSPDKLRFCIQNGIEFGFEYMKINTPVRTGRLRDSEGISMISDTEGEMHANAEYAGYVNDGTSHQRPQPFFDTGVYVAYNRIQDNAKKL